MPSYKNLAEYLLTLGVDGMITDYPNEFRRLLEHKGNKYPLPPVGNETRIMGCLAKYNQITKDKLDGLGYVLKK
jgi:hypothetical protein